MTKLLRLTILLLLAASIFDPSDLLVHAKVPLFILVWALTLADLLVSSGSRTSVPPQLYFYAFVFVVLLPALGMLIYILRGGGMEGYEGFQYLKAYLFLSLCVPLAMKQIDLIRPLSYLLTLLSLATLLIYAVTINDESLRTQLALFGDVFTIFSLTERTYASFTYESVYFHASPLLVLALVYFCYHFLHSEGVRKWWNLLLLLLNGTAMFVSGTRNNMLVAIMAPLLVIAWYRTGRTRFAVYVALGILAAVGIASGVAEAMFSADEYSNAIKIGHLHDYGVLFSDWRTLLFGQGLGATFFSTVWGTSVSLTELSYVEIVRNYGLLFSPILFALVLYPLRKLADHEARCDHYLFLGYACYLYLCTANPLLLSSSGMLVLSIVLYRTFTAQSGLLPRMAAATA